MATITVPATYPNGRACRPIDPYFNAELSAWWVPDCCHVDGLEPVIKHNPATHQCFHLRDGDGRYWRRTSSKPITVKYIF